MKKLLLFTLSAGLSFGTFAQSTVTRYNTNKTIKGSLNTRDNNSAARTTAIGDTVSLSNITSADTPTLYTLGTAADSGLCAGINAFGEQAFAERFDFNGADSTAEVIGLISVFGGVINPSSTKTVVFNVWSVGAQTTSDFGANIFNSGFPNSVLTSASVPLTGIYLDSFQVTGFTTPTSNLSSFFVGYSIAYTPTNFGGDTVSLYSSISGERTAPLYTVSGTDTIINNVNVSQLADSSWIDNATENFQLFYDYYIFPIVVIENPSISAVKGVTRNNLTFYGNYPNPAVDNTNIKFSLANNTDVTITITDMAGHTVNTLNEANLGTGMHIIPVSTINMTAGDYIYLIRTASGDGMASKLTVIK